MTSSVTPSTQDEFDQLFADKYTSNRHPEDEATASDHSDDDTKQPERFVEKDDNDDDDDLINQDTLNIQANMRSRYFLPRTRSEANTGPKGVIADAQSYEQAKKAQRFSIFRSAKDVTTPHVAEITEKPDDDDAFMERWRLNRLAELASPDSRMQSRSRNGSPGRRVFGNLVTVDAEGFLDCVEYAPEDATVIVFIYDDASDTSDMVETCVRQLASQHKYTRFVRMHYDEAEIEVAGVPALLAYRGGDKFAGMVPVMDEIPDDAELNATTLESVMKKQQML